MVTLARLLAEWGIPGSLAGRAACVRRIAATLSALDGAQNVSRDRAVPTPRGGEKAPPELDATQARIAELECALCDARTQIARLQLEVSTLRRSPATTRKLAALARR